MNKLLAPLIVLSLVALLTPALSASAFSATANEIEIDFDPNTLMTNISWDFGNNPDRETCNSKTETYFDPYRNGYRYETPLKSWNGLNYEDAVTTTNNTMAESFANSDSIIDCKGNISFSQYEVHTPHPGKDYDTELFMSFGEVLKDGSITALNEADIQISTVYVYPHTQNCNFDQFDKTTFIDVFPYTATQYEEAKDMVGCTSIETDLTMEPQYIMFFNMLWNSWAIP